MTNSYQIHVHKPRCTLLILPECGGECGHGSSKREEEREINENEEDWQQRTRSFTHLGGCLDTVVSLLLYTAAVGVELEINNQ